MLLIAAFQLAHTVTEQCSDDWLSNLLPTSTVYHYTSGWQPHKLGKLGLKPHRLHKTGTLYHRTGNLIYNQLFSNSSSALSQSLFTRVTISESISCWRLSSQTTANDGQLWQQKWITHCHGRQQIWDVVYRCSPYARILANGENVMLIATKSE